MLSHQQQQSRTVSHPRWIPWVAKAVNIALRPLPFARRWISGTISNRYGRVGRLRDEGKREEAFDLAVRTIPHCMGSTGIRGDMKRLFFWLLMTHAADLVETFEQQQQVLELLLRAPGPGGVQEAAVLEQVSRWSWLRGQAPQAVEMARAAVKADPKWPWAYLTLAFYLQQSKLGDPLPVIVDAVRADPACWPEIEERFDAEIASAVRSAMRPA